MNDKQKPSIRFKGFTEAWEQRKLGEIAKITIGEFVIKTKQDDSFPYPVFNGGSLNTGFYSEFNNEGNKVLVSARGANAGFVNIIKTRYWAGNSCYSIDINDKNKYYTDFIFHQMKQNQSKFIENQQAANIPSVSKSDVENYDATIPCFDEQIKISSYLNNLDHLITLHQRKYDKLVNVKKSMLEKMFPQDGKNVPEIRFSGFTEAWEQHKLGEVVSVYDGVHQTPNYKNSGVMFLSVENITTLKSDKFISEEAFQKNYKVYPQKGDVLMTRIGDVGTPNVVETSEKVAYYVSLALLKPVRIDSYFLKNCIQSPLFQKGLKDRTLVTAIPQKINKDEIGKVDMFLPVSQSEQEQIGAYFKHLDHLITLHQRELEKLQNIKKSCLEKMFV